VLKEAEFTFRQAFAFCPYSPEAVFRYCQLLMQLRRFEDSQLIAETCLKLDPYNGQVRGLVETIKQIRKESAGYDQFRGNLARAEEEVRTNPENFQAAFDLAGDYLQMQATDRAVAVLEKIRENPKADPAALRSLLQGYASFGNTDGLQKTVDKLSAIVRSNPANLRATLDLADGYRYLHKTPEAVQALDQAVNSPNADSTTILAAASSYAALGNASRLEAALEKLTKVMPESPEAWYDLAVVRAGTGKNTEGLAAIQKCLQLNAQRLQHDPKASNLLLNARNEARFGPLRQTPEFQKLVGQ
jgi:thioredoxin-like negative regulator of GroEL